MYSPIARIINNFEFDATLNSILKGYCPTTLSFVWLFFYPFLFDPNRKEQMYRGEINLFENQADSIGENSLFNQCPLSVLSFDLQLHAVLPSKTALLERGTHLS